MSILQSKNSNLRFLKRKNLEEEARVVGTWYSDLINQYGLDCIYFKLNTKVFGNFKNIVDKNTVLYHAYGYNINPDYSCSAMMVTYPEVQTDIFQLNKFGNYSQSEIDFHFDAKQFACDLATQCGQLREFKIKEKDIVFQVPNCTNETSSVTTDDGQLSTIYLSSLQFPYSFGLGYRENFECEILSGHLSGSIPGYEYGKTYTMACDVVDTTHPCISFDKDEDLYRSLEYQINGDMSPEIMVFLRYKVDKIIVGQNPKTGYEEYRSILSGNIFGGVLFYDVAELQKYVELIHPEVGDVIAIDFPDESSREQYEITDCYDKSLQSDGISPLLHKYIWKCKARRRVDSYDGQDIVDNEDDQRNEEKLKYDQVVSEQVSKTISMYDDGDQEAYGGYDGVIKSFDKQSTIKINKNAVRYDQLEENQCIDIIRFSVGSRLVTDGYDLIFVTSNSDPYIVAKDVSSNRVVGKMFECDLKWLKATDDCIVFINAEGECCRIAEDEEATEYEVQICLQDINEKTIDTALMNKNNDSFIKFNNCRSLMFATEDHLFAKLQSNGKLYKLI